MTRFDQREVAGYTGPVALPGFPTAQSLCASELTDRGSFPV
ncbi:MAG: hypothetical protein QOK10_941, partial [Pseudonocardiales bacterium]|nr:hypothetical protein [Pseudonocardiales bacterium]